MTTNTMRRESNLYRDFSTYIVDDDALLVDEWEVWVTDWNWPVVGKSSDTEKAGIEIVEYDPAILLVDIQFGERRDAGIELVKSVRSIVESKGGRIPFVIFITGLAKVAQMAISEIPFSRVLNKPIRESDLEEAMEFASLSLRQLRQLRDAQWALKNLSLGKFNDLPGDFIGVFDQSVVRTGNDELQVREEIAEIYGVPREEIIVEFKGDLF